jgi:Ulp1 family protease
LSIFKEQLVDLKNGEWLSNSIIDFFHWKLIDVLSKLGVKDVYKRFKFMDSGFVYYKFLAKEEYDFSAWHHWATKKDMNDDGHIFSFLSHEVICVPVNMKNMHWILFYIIPVNREMLVIDSLYDPTSP